MIKFNDSWYQDGVAQVVIDTEIGKFYGMATVHPEEEEKYQSEFTGCQIAETRATLQYYKEILKRLNIEIKVLEELRRKGTHTSDLDKMIKNKQDYKKQLVYIVKSLKHAPMKISESRTKFIDTLEEKEKRAKKISGKE